MIPFVISPKENIKGNFDRSLDHGYWVLAIDERAQRFLIADEDSEFHWLKSSDCVIRFCVTPPPQHEEPPHPLPANILEGLKNINLQESK